MDTAGVLFLLFIAGVLAIILFVAVSAEWQEEFECVGLGKVSFADRGTLECVYTTTENSTEVCYYCNKRIKVWVRE